MNHSHGEQLGWRIANAIVRERFQAAAIDAIPIYSQAHGLERFVLTRRLACVHRQADAPDAFGTILLHGDDAPCLIAGEERTTLDAAMLSTPETVTETLRRLVPAPDPGPGNHDGCWHVRAAPYPGLYEAVSRLIATHPGTTAGRAVYVDDQHLDGTYHPLYLHGVVTQPGFVYDWFSVEAGAHSVFIRINGEQTLHQTERGAWRAIGPVLREASADEIGRRLRTWLRLTPDS